MIRDYKELQAWQKGMDLVEAVYRETRQFPSDERFGLVAQLRRASVSVPANVAEGFGRRTKSDFMRFLDVALGSSNEVETHLLISRRLGLLDGAPMDELVRLTHEVQRILKGLLRSLKASSREGLKPEMG